MFTTVWFKIANGNSLNCLPTDEWMKEMQYIHNGILFNHIEEWNQVIFRKVDGTGIHCIKWSSPDSAKYYTFPLMWEIWRRREREEKRKSTNIKVEKSLIWKRKSTEEGKERVRQFMGIWSKYVKYMDKFAKMKYTSLYNWFTPLIN